MTHPALIHLVEQTSANVRNICDSLEVDLLNDQVHLAVHAMCLTLLESNPSIQTQVLVDAWREAVRVR